MTGIFINFEGVDGAGKTGQITRVKQHLDSLGIKSIITHEPGGTPFAELIRDLTKRKDISEEVYPMTELLLFFASRFQHHAAIIEPALKNDYVILCDRYTPSSIAYQSLGGLDSEKIMELHRYVVGDVWPDINVLIDISAEESFSRLDGRTELELDRIEIATANKKQKLRDSYLNQARVGSSNFVVVNGMAHPDEVYESIKSIVNAAIEKSGIYGNEKRG